MPTGNNGDFFQAPLPLEHGEVTVQWADRGDTLTVWSDAIALQAADLAARAWKYAERTPKSTWFRTVRSLVRCASVAARFLEADARTDGATKSAA